MTARITTKPSAGLFAAIAHAITTVALRAWRCAAALKHRHELRRLLDCEDRLLADIGISRDDLRSALSEPFWRDPTTALAARAGKPIKTPTLPGASSRPILARRSVQVLLQSPSGQER
jgi:uncharacterized protein YjiS (DUF1127 family)